MYKDRSGNFRQRSRAFQKRTWLANLLSLGAGVTVSVAGSVAYSFDGVTLPTRVNDGQAVVRSNPFVATAPKLTAPSGDILQTSDLRFSELHLKSIGTAVGLVPIGNPRPTEPTLEVSQPEPSKVRVNPLATVHSSDFDRPVIGLVEVPVLPPPSKHLPESVDAHESAHRSQTRIVGLKYVEASVPEGTLAAVTEAEPIVQESPNLTMETSNPIPVSAEAAVATDVVKTDAVEPEQTGVSFSLTDLGGDQVDAELDSVSNDTESSAEIASVDPINAPAELLIPPPIACSTPHRSFAAETEVKRPLDVQNGESLADRLPLLPTPNLGWTKHQGAEALQASNGSNVIRYPNRRRAHVEVVPPPMISVQPEQGHRQNDTAKVVSTRIVPAKLAGFQMKPPEGSKVPSAAEESVATKAVSENSIVTLMKRIRKTYSSSRIQISEVKGEVLVRGVCATQEDATDIVRLVRSEFLVPVDDQLVIR